MSRFDLPRVSVVMSACNDAEHVGRAVASILTQTFRDFELIVIDDGSRDDTGAVLEVHANADPRVRVIRQENRGLTLSLIAGCAMARGEYIARQDADDWSHPRRLEEQVALLDGNPRVGFASCATEYVGPAGEHLCYMHRPVDPELATSGLLNARQGPPAHGSVMIRKTAYEAVGGYRAEFRYSQDSDLWLRLAENWLVAYLPEVRYQHRKEADSISGAQRAEQSEFARLAHACRAARLAGTSEQVSLQSAEALSRRLAQTRKNRIPAKQGEISYLIGSQLVRNGDARAAHYLWSVIRRHPWHWRAWLRLLQGRLGIRGAGH